MSCRIECGVKHVQDTIIVLALIRIETGIINGEVIIGRDVPEPIFQLPAVTRSGPNFNSVC